MRLRGDFGFMVYGRERLEYCYTVPVGCRVGLDLTTTNGILFAGLGPEVILGGGPVRPYLHGSFGLSYFVTTSSLSGEGDAESFATTTNHDDIVLAWRGGAGVRVRVRGGPKPVSIDVGLERHQNGVVSYLTEGDIVDNADGSVTLQPRRSEANLVSLRLGVTLGVPRRESR